MIIALSLSQYETYATGHHVTADFMGHLCQKMSVEHQIITQRNRPRGLLCTHNK